MGRFQDRFDKLNQRKEGAYVPFFVLGDPDYQTSLDLIKIAIENGADALELGFWFSDPIADGPSIQEADIRAKKAGMDVDKAFYLISKIREFDKEIPMGLLVYYQLVFARNGFCKDVANAGADAILMPDLPIEYVKHEKIDLHNLDQVFLVAPSTNDERLEKIAQSAKGFIYQVARRGVTGAREEMQQSTLELVARTRRATERYHNTPIVAGFGISKPEHVSAVLAAGADGAITGSALCNIIAKHLNDKTEMYSTVSKYVKSIKQATYLTPMEH